MIARGTEPGGDVAATAAEPRPAWGRRVALSGAGWLLVAALLECGVETVLRGSPLRWYVAAGVLAWILAVVLARRVIGDPARIATGLLLFCGLVAFVTWRLGAAADPGLHLCGLSLPRIGVGVVALSLVSVLVLIGRLRLPRRAGYVVGALVALGAYGLLPFAVALVRGIPVGGVMRGDALWPGLPGWLQGGVIASQVLLPVGFLIAAGASVRAALRRDSRPRPLAPALAAAVILTAFFVASIEMSRAGLSNLAGPLFRSSAHVATTAGARHGSPPDTGSVVSIVTPPPPSGATAATRAIEMTVDGVESVPAIAGTTAPAGRTFVIVSTTWKALTSTEYVVSNVGRHLWLIADDRYSEPVDERATREIDRRLPFPSFSIRPGSEPLKGRVAFIAPSDASYLALLYLDNEYGNASVTVRGRPSGVPRGTLGPARKNTAIALAVTEVAWAKAGPSPPPGMKRLTLGLRGTSASPGNVAEIRFGRFGHLVTDTGYMAEPEPDAAWLARPWQDLAVFPPGAVNEGQLSFLVPDDVKQTMLILRAGGGGNLDLPAPDEVRPSWPTPARTIPDGTIARVYCLPAVPPPSALPAPPQGQRLLVLDFVVENLTAAQDIEFQASEQLRVLDGAGTLFSPSPDSKLLPYRLAGNAVVPAGCARRFHLLYLVPAGQPLWLEYRGFEVKSEKAELRTD